MPPTTHRVTMDEIKVGQPLPWDVYGQDGVLLLRRGQSVHTQRGLERLIEEGLFVQSGGTAPARGEQPAVVEEKPSALQLLVDARRILNGILEQKPENLSDFPSRLEKVVQAVHSACDTHPRVALSTILLLHDKYSSTVKHAIDTAILSNVLARELGQDEAAQRSIVAAALTMNIGMYEVQEKVNGIIEPLTDKLMSMIRTHPTLSADRLAKLGITDERWLTIVRQHHEHNDGSGYPAGLEGEAIDMGARILGVADKYCAMVSARSYRSALKPNAALRDLYIKHGQKIDIAVAGTMIRVIGIYPIGTLVRLKSGEIGVVTGEGEGPDTPAVHVIVGRSGAALDVAAARKTHLAEFAIEDVLTIDKLSIPVRLGAIWGKDAKLS